MRPDEILISYVVTVYKKEPYVGHTVRSLIGQEGGLPAEYIFVDDNSPDRSVAVIEDITRGMPNVVIVQNMQNAGPSVRLNQGARLARGKYLQFIDSDDILAANASLTMFTLLQKHDADVIYGCWKKTGIPSAELLGRRIDDDAPYKMSDVPLSFQFEQRILRMTQMVARETFLASGGCDERVFIQDESLAIRLARVARKLIWLDAPVVLVPKVEGELSRNLSQMNHDRFCATRNLLLDFPDMDEQSRRLFYRRCVSAAWKQVRHERSLPMAMASRAFVEYLRSRIALPAVHAGKLARMSDYFAGVKGVRRIA